MIRQIVIEDGTKRTLRIEVVGNTEPYEDAAITGQMYLMAAFLAEPQDECDRLRRAIFRGVNEYLRERFHRYDL